VDAALYELGALRLDTDDLVVRLKRTSRCGGVPETLFGHLASNLNGGANGPRPRRPTASARVVGAGRWFMVRDTHRLVLTSRNAILNVIEINGYITGICGGVRPVDAEYSLVVANRDQFNLPFGPEATPLREDEILGADVGRECRQTTAFRVCNDHRIRVTAAKGSIDRV
jgi:hypothetical protein